MKNPKKPILELVADWEKEVGFMPGFVAAAPDKSFDQVKANLLMIAIRTMPSMTFLSIKEKKQAMVSIASRIEELRGRK